MSKATSLYYRWTALIINQPLKIISCLILLSLSGLGLFLVEGRLNSDLGQLIVLMGFNEITEFEDRFK